MHTLHIFCGLPASGKTTLARELCKRIGAAFFDSDTTTDLMIQAAHLAAGLDPHDRDTSVYKATYREAVYETLFALAEENLAHTDVVIAGPFTSELKNKGAWEKELQERFSTSLVILYPIIISEELRLKRMKERGALRDKGKES
ncbi:ATP-binding protein [Akkermansiaceae bacterium]|nr:ATP-binding protein [Akkermansiaceae bacterium]